MRTKIVALVLGLVLAASAAGAVEPSTRPAPGESRSLLDQGAVGRLRQMFGSGDSGDEQAAPRTASRPPSSARRTTTRAPRRSYGRTTLLNRPRPATHRAAPAVPLADDTAPAAPSSTATEAVTAAPTPAAITVPRQEANLVDISSTTTASPTTQLASAMQFLPIIRAAERPVMPSELARAPSANDPLFDIPRNTNPSPLLAAEVQGDPRSLEVGLSPAPRLIPEQPMVEEPAPAPAEPAPALPETELAMPEPVYAPPPTIVHAVPRAATISAGPEQVAIGPPPTLRTTAIAPRPVPQQVAVQPVIIPAAPRATLPPEQVPVAPIALQPVTQPFVQQPIVQQPAPQPIVQQPAPQPIVQQPVPQPIVQQPAPQPIVQQPGPQPIVQGYVPQPIATEPVRATAPPTALAQPADFVAQPANNASGVLRRVESRQPAPAAFAHLTAAMIGPKEIYSGDTGIFKVRLVNEGNAPAKEVRVEIRADDALLKTLNVGAIPAKTDVEVEIALSPNKTGAMELRAIATGDAGVKAVAGSVVFIGKPELSLAIAGPPQLDHGDLKQYTAILNNTGNCDATNVSVMVMLQGEESQSLKVGVVPAGQTRQVRFELRPEQAGQLSVNAVASADGNVQAVANGTINVVKNEVQLAFDGPRQMRFGEKVVYTLTVNNSGNADAENLVVNVTLGDSVLERLYEGTLAAGKEEKISFEVSPSKPGFHALRAAAIGAGKIKSATSAKLQVQHGELEIVVESPTVKFAGAEAVYKVRVKNIGDAAAEDVLVTAHLPESIKFHGGVDRIDFYDGITWRIGQMTPGQEEAFELQCELSAPGEQKVVFNASGADDLEASQTVTTAVEALADVRLFVADPQGLVPVGQDVVYEIEVHNRGVKPAQNIEVVMQLSSSLEPIQVAGGEAKVEARGVVFDSIATLAAKETIKLRVTARAKEKGSHQFRVEMTADEPSTFMASEGTTRFYGNTALDAAASATREE